MNNKAMVTTLTAIGWSSDGASFIAERADDPRLYRIVSRLLGIRHPGRVEIPEYLRWEVWEHDDFRCRWCGSRRYLHIDHIVAISAGGTNALENLQTLCRSCNSKKGSR